MALQEREWPDWVRAIVDDAEPQERARLLSPPPGFLDHPWVDVLIGVLSQHRDSGTPHDYLVEEFNRMVHDQPPP